MPIFFHAMTIIAASVLSAALSIQYSSQTTPSVKPLNMAKPWYQKSPRGRKTIKAKSDFTDREKKLLSSYSMRHRVISEDNLIGLPSATVLTERYGSTMLGNMGSKLRIEKSKLPFEDHKRFSVLRPLSSEIGDKEKRYFLMESIAEAEVIGSDEKFVYLVVKMATSEIQSTDLVAVREAPEIVSFDDRFRGEGRLLTKLRPGRMLTPEMAVWLSLDQIRTGDPVGSVVTLCHEKFAHSGKTNVDGECVGKLIIVSSPPESGLAIGLLTQVTKVTPSMMFFSTGELK